MHVPARATVATPIGYGMIDGILEGHKRKNGTPDEFQIVLATFEALLRLAESDVTTFPVNHRVASASLRKGNKMKKTGALGAGFDFGMPGLSGLSRLGGRRESGESSRAAIARAGLSPPRLDAGAS